MFRDSPAMSSDVRSAPTSGNDWTRAEKLLFVATWISKPSGWGKGYDQFRVKLVRVTLVAVRLRGAGGSVMLALAWFE